MNCNLEYLKVFYYVAFNKNITKTAQELYISQPAVSKSIKNLESQLNVKLFNRSKKGVLPTKQGEILFNTIDKLFKELNNSLDEITKNEQKVINISVGKTILKNTLLKYIEEYNKIYPKVRLNISNMSQPDNIKNIENNQIDLLIGYYQEKIPSNLKQIKLNISLHQILVCSNKYKELINNKINLDFLTDYNFILNAKGSSSRNYIDNIFKLNNFNPNNIMEIQGTSSVIQLINQGLGIGILTKEFITNELENKELFEINLKEKLPKRYLSITYLKNKILDKEAEEFINLLTNK